MNGLNNSAEEVVECPLCMEPLEVDDLNFYPCTCGYQICRFCWHRIRTDENELCPACRKAYPENPADFTPLTQEEMIAFKSQKRQRDQQRKQKITENRKHLANVRVVQKNLVFVVGLPPRLADADILKKHEYFGKYGKIHKVVINPSTTYAGVQGPSASAYVTYVNNSDALRAIQSVNNINIDGRPIKTSLGTTKYCSHFMKNQQCPKSDCMYLHELGDPEASFTKEEMHQGKHQEYEKRLHETLLANSALSSNGSNNTTSGGTNPANGSGRSIDICKPTNGNNSVANPSAMSSSLSSSSSSYSTPMMNSNTSTAIATSGQQKEAWPSLSVSPINNKDSNTIFNGKTKKDRVKYQEKLRNEKSAKVKSKAISSINGNFNLTNKENIQTSRDTGSLADPSVGEQNNIAIIQNKKNDKSKTDKIISNRNCRDQQHPEKHSINVDDEVQLIDDSETFNSSVDEKKKSKNTNQNCKNELSSISSKIDNGTTKGDGQRSLSSSSNTSIASSNSNSSSCEDSIKQSTSAVGDNNSGKSSPLSTSSVERSSLPSQSCQQTNNGKSDTHTDINADFSCENKKERNVIESSDIFSETQPIPSSNGVDGSNLSDTTAALSNLNLFDDHNSFFSSSMASLHQSLLLRNKLEAEMRQNHVNSSFTSQLPDLLSGIDGFQNNAASSDELQKAFKNVMMMRNSKHLEDQQQQQQLNQQHQIHQQLQQQEELMRIQEMQTRNNLINNIGISQIIGPHGDLQNIGNNAFDSNDINRLSQAALLQQQMLQQQTHQSDQVLGNNIFGMNMSKFFDFHKNQQQQIHQQFMLNGGHNNSSANSGSFNDHLRLNTLLENNRLNSQFLDQTNSLLSSQQHQLQKQRLKYDTSSGQNVQQSSGQPNPQGQQQVQQSRIANQYSQNSSVDDDLGFDPFIETQKALAELMENELVQQQNINHTPGSNNPSVAAKLLHQQQQQHMLDNMQRPRMPPPGFNHMNAFAFGIPRTQNTSKILPFMNGGNSVGGNSPMGNGSWNSHLGAFPQQQPQQLNETQIQQLTQNQNSVNHKAYGNNDWTAMDPAILSFRQFSFPQQSHMPHPSHQQDFFVQNMPQQNLQGFGGSQAQLHCGNVNLPNGMMNSQQASPGQVNANVQGMLEYLKNRQFI